MYFNINSDACVQHTRTLEKMHRKHLPSAIRSTLNRAVFTIKTKTLPAKAKQVFTEREKTFFKVASQFKNATGWDVNSFKAIVGMDPAKLRNSNTNFAVSDLEQQEYGGEIGGKSFIPMDAARFGKSNTRAVRPGNRISKLKNRLYSAAKAPGKNRGERFIRTAIWAGRGAFVLTERDSRGRRFLVRIDSLRKSKTDKIKSTALYVYKKGRSINVKQKSFMRDVTNVEASKMEEYYTIEAKREIQKAIAEQKKSF